MSARAAAVAEGVSAPPPRANPDLLGHEPAEQALRAAARSGRLAHAWLITGPPGIGKATLAFRFARYLLAANDPGASAGAGLPGLAGNESGDEPGYAAGNESGDEPRYAVGAGLFTAPDDPAFRRVASGGHADLLTVERGYDDRRDRLRREIVVDDVRAVGAFLAQTPAEGGWRIVVVDSADALNRNAANALLKVLEEPPDRALLLLVSDAPGGLLATIRSRCRRLALRPLPAAAVDVLLARYRPSLEALERRDLVDLAGGSVGRALALAEAGVGRLQREVRGLFLSLPALDVPALHRLCDDVLRRNEDGFTVLAELIRWWLGRLVRRAAAGAEQAASAGDDADSDRLGAVAAAAPLDRWLEVWEKTERRLAVTDSANLDRRQVLLAIFLDIAAATRR